MSRRWKYLAPLALFAVLLGFLAVGLNLNPREVPSPFIGKPAPAFDLPRLDDPAQRITNQDLAGKVWILNVWASWCAACHDEHPVLVEFARRGKVPIYGLNYKDERGNAIAWLSRLGNPYAASLSDTDGRVGINFGVYGVPETFVIDRDGIIRKKHIGPLSPEVWTQEVLPLIQKLKG